MLKFRNPKLVFEHALPEFRHIRKHVLLSRQLRNTAAPFWIDLDVGRSRQARAGRQGRRVGRQAGRQAGRQ